MKILLTTDWWAPAVNGVVRSVMLLRRELLAQGHDVRVLTLSPDRSSYEKDGVIYLGSLSADRVYPGARVRFAAWNRWMRALTEWRPDVIHSQCEFSTFLPAWQLARRCSCPLVHTYHTVYEDYTRYLIPSERCGRVAVKEFTRLVSGRCDAILAPTGKVTGLLKEYGVSCPVYTVPTGIDLEAFRPIPPSDKPALRRALGLPEGETILVSVGRLAAEKNHGELLRLLAKEPAGRRPLLLFVGDGPVRLQLEQQAADLGLVDRVMFAGMVPPGEVVRYYQAGDAFVCASQSETQGLTYFEALACGLPAIVRADPCLDGVVEDGVNGWQWKDAAGFAAALAALGSGPDICAALRKGALATAERYSAGHFAAQALAVYREALDRRRAGPGGLPAGVPAAASGVGFFLCLWLAVWAWQKGLLTDLAALQAFVAGLGVWAAAAFVAFQAVQVVIPVLPGGLGCLAGVILFGPWYGFAYNYLGICAGSLAAFGVARYCGRPLLERMFSPRLLRRYDSWLGNKSFAKWFALAIFFPVAPDDFLCYLAGTTSMRWGQFTFIILTCKPFAIAAYSTGLTVAMNTILRLL